MRIGETLIVLADLAGLISLGYRPSWFGGAATAISLLVLIHLFFEESRWQMVPAYVVSFGIGVCGLAGVASTYRVSTVASLLAAAMLLASVMLSIVDRKSTRLNSS